MASWDHLPSPALAALFVGAAFVLGVAIQYGTTCAVRAVSELIRNRRADTFIGFFECGLWALLTVWLLTPEVAVPQWGPLGWLCFGAALFGVGATINGGCAFGSIARLGEGRLEFILTGVGAFAAFRLLDAFGYGIAFLPQQDPVPQCAPLIVLSGLPTLVLFRLALWRRPLRPVLELSLLMGVIGVVGVFVGSLHQPWPWMLALRFIGASDWLTMLGLLGLISGSIIHGMLRRRFRFARPSLAEMRNRFAGGLLMGAGSALVPGGNDSLILQGVPAGSPSAFLAYGVLLVAIAGMMLALPRLNVH